MTQVEGNGTTASSGHVRARHVDVAALLADASAPLIGAVDAAQALGELARRCVPALGDACAIDALDDGRQERRVAAIGDLADGAHRVRAVMAVGDREVGALMFSRAAPYSPEEVTLVHELARRAAAALAAARVYRAADEANRAKDVFLATLSHELRTPLNAILGWTQILLGAPGLNEKAARALGVIDRNARAQARLIADLLDVSRIVTGKLKVDPVPLEIAPIIDGAIDAARPAADAKGVRLVKSIAAIGEVKGDPVRIAQIAGNLLSNAIKFTPPGGEVSVALELTERDVRLVVRDTGVGIGAEFLPYVFDRFRQADGAQRQAGLGLGLAIVRHLVELHGGRVSASSEGKGRGATFVVELPRTSEPALIRAAPRPFEVGPRALVGANVLLVEDNPDSRELIEIALGDFGARVTAVASAAAALEALELTRPDVLVSDIGLPDEDGFALMQRVRALPADRGGATPAVALTAYASREDSARAIEAGFHAHVAKPVTAADLGATLARVLAYDRGA